jgi:hypothetical protein
MVDGSSTYLRLAIEILGHRISPLKMTYRSWPSRNFLTYLIIKHPFQKSLSHTQRKKCYTEDQKR